MGIHTLMLTPKLLVHDIILKRSSHDSEEWPRYEFVLNLPTDDRRLAVIWLDFIVIRFRVGVFHIDSTRPTLNSGYFFDGIDPMRVNIFTRMSSICEELPGLVILVGKRFARPEEAQLFGRQLEEMVAGLKEGVEW